MSLLSYGEKGFLIIGHTVRFLFPKDFIDIWHFFPLTWETLTTQVLIPTAASLLISQDLGIPV
jgi:hypothetical protein